MGHLERQSHAPAAALQGLSAVDVIRHTTTTRLTMLLSIPCAMKQWAQLPILVFFLIDDFK